MSAVMIDDALRNHFLASLPEASLDRVLPELEHVELALSFELAPARQPMRHVYFPVQGIVSITTAERDGRAIEVATVGNEGLVALPLMFYADRAAFTFIVQVPGDGFRLRAQRFSQLYEEDVAFRRVALACTHALLAQIGISSACNRLHSSEQRCARWLLQAHDRVDGDRFLLTHEFLSEMLGVRRATVSEVAGILQARGLITYSRGVISILDRDGLEAACCECYGLIAREQLRLVPAEPPRG